MILSNFLFAGYLEDREDILLVCHKHIWVYRVPLTKEFLLGIALPVIFYLLYPPLLVLWGVWLIIGFLRFVYTLADWYYDSWLVTNMGIVDVEWNGFFNRSSNRIEYHTVDGISYKIQGFWQTVFNYGQVQIQQIGGTRIVNMNDAMSPKSIERSIIAIQNKFIGDKTHKEHEALKDILTSLVQTTLRK